jgi:hypothetical protein
VRFQNLIFSLGYCSESKSSPQQKPVAQRAQKGWHQADWRTQQNVHETSEGAQQADPV